MNKTLPMLLAIVTIPACILPARAGQRTATNTVGAAQRDLTVGAPNTLKKAKTHLQLQKQLVGPEKYAEKSYTMKIPAPLAVSDNNGIKNGALITSINGVSRPPISIRYGTTLDIHGAHLGTLRKGSVVGLYPPNSSTGMAFQILSWSDSLIRVSVTSQTPIQSTDAATLIIAATNAGTTDTHIALHDVHYAPYGRPYRDNDRRSGSGRPRTDPAPTLPPKRLLWRGWLVDRVAPDRPR